MSEKALTRRELEITQRMQTHFPHGDIPEEILQKWQSANLVQMQQAMFRFVAYTAFRHPIVTVPLVIDEKLSGDEMVALGKYKSVHSGILGAQLGPQCRHLSGTPVTHCTAVLLPAVRNWSGKECAVSDILKAGFHVASIWELLALGYQYPALQMNGPIMALGTSFGLNAPVLGEMLGQRTLDLMDLPGCGYRGRFLAIV